MSLAEWFNLAVRYHKIGNLREAEALYRRTLEADPQHAAAHHLLGLLAHQAGRHEAALTLIRQAIALDPQAAVFRFNLGIVLKDLGQPAEAARSYREALALEPGSVDTLCNLGVALRDLGQPAEAVRCYRQALRVSPSHAETLNNLGNALKDLGQAAEAAASFRQALAARPGYANAHYNLGGLFKDEGRLAEAAQSFRAALAANPRHADAHNNLGVCLMYLGANAEALEQFEQVLATCPDNGTALWNRSLLRLADGDFERAWPDYEYRWTQPGFVRAHGERPRWDGSPLAGKTILLHAEQGLGDTIQFLRYAPLVRERGGRVVCECQAALVQLLAGSAGVDAMIPAGAPLPPFDVQAPLLSLPGIFGTNLATIPAPIPYLRAEPARVDFWRGELASLCPKNSELTPRADLKVGIAWQGSLSHKGDRYRSIPLGHFEALARIDGVRLVSLQKGTGSAQLHAGAVASGSGPGVLPVIDLGDRLDQAGAFLDTAAVMMNLDLVITIDSAVAHVAGALGVPVWVLLSSNPDWRWLRERQNSPWYPTMRLFRQQRLGAWGDVFERVATELGTLCSRCQSASRGTALPSRPEMSATEADGSRGTALPSRPEMSATDADGSGEPSHAISPQAGARAGGADGGAFFNQGLRHKELGELAEAAHCFREAVRANPGFVDGLNNLGLALKELARRHDGDPGEAIAAFRQALALAPGHGTVAYNLGNLLMEQGELEQAAQCFRTTLRRHPHHVGASNNLGNVLMEMGELEEAAACYAVALRQRPEHAPTRWNRARLRLLLGDLPAAWADYEYRWLKPGMDRRHGGTPRWDGGPLAGKTILLYPEQGLGDTIQFLRYASLVKARGGTVLFECPPYLVPLLTGMAGIDHIITEGAALPSDSMRIDVQAPLLSLPGIFGTTLASVPATVPYLRADAGLVEAWRRELKGSNISRPSGPWQREFTMGIAWQGNPNHPADRYRSIPLARFESLARIPGVRLVSLQKGPGSEQIEAWPLGTILDLGARLDATGAFLDSAAILMSLDLVVTVDSAVAHLAGALAVPVWVPLTLAPDWRWLREREDSPWYPTMRLFRQRRLGDWSEVFERIAAQVRSVMALPLI